MMSACSLVLSRRPTTLPEREAGRGAGWTAFLLPPAEGSTKPRLADMRESFSWSAGKRDSGHLIAPPERLSTGRAFRRGREWVKLPDAPDRPISAQTVRFASAANEPFRRNAGATPPPPASPPPASPPPQRQSRSCVPPERFVRGR